MAWPTTEGTITTKVERFKRLFRWLPRVSYTYGVGENSYASDRISFVAGYRKKEVDEVLQRYIVGQTVPVYYPPEKPAAAVLEPGSNKQVTAPIRMLLGMTKWIFVETGWRLEGDQVVASVTRSNIGIPVGMSTTSRILRLTESDFTYRESGDSSDRTEHRVAEIPSLR